MYAHILLALYLAPTKVCSVYTERNHTATTLNINCIGYERTLREERATVTVMSQNIYNTIILYYNISAFL